jgi:hypothetical protein
LHNIPKTREIKTIIKREIPESLTFIVLYRYKN